MAIIVFIYDSRNSMVLLEKRPRRAGAKIYDSRNSMVLLEMPPPRGRNRIYDSRNSMVLLERIVLGGAE